jgi:hypothetical protein
VDKIKLSNLDILEIYPVIADQINGNFNKKFNHCLNRNERLLKPVYKTVSKTRDDFTEEKRILCEDYCEKDKDNKPIKYPAENGGFNYKGLNRGENPEFDKKFDKFLERLNSFLDKEIEVEYYKIPYELVPETFLKKWQDIISPFIVDFPEDEKEEKMYLDLISEKKDKSILSKNEVKIEK